MSEQGPLKGIDVENLTFVDEPVPELPPPGADVMVVNSSRIPVELDQWIKRTADHRGVKESVIVRELLELGRSAYEGADRAVTLTGSVKQDQDSRLAHSRHVVARWVSLAILSPPGQRFHDHHGLREPPHRRTTLRDRMTIARVANEFRVTSPAAGSSGGTVPR